MYITYACTYIQVEENWSPPVVEKSEAEKARISVLLSKTALCKSVCMYGYIRVYIYIYIYIYIDV